MSTESWWNPPANTGDAEFVAALRELRTRLGLSYRVPERRAAQAGDVLPSSTLNSALSRTTPPSEQVLTAFLRACGADEETIERWRAARAELTVEPVSLSPLPDGSGISRRRRFVLVAALAVLVVAAGVLVALAPGRRDVPSDRDAAGQTPPTTGSSAQQVGQAPATAPAVTPTTRAVRGHEPAPTTTSVSKAPEPRPGDDDWDIPPDTWSPTSSKRTTTTTEPAIGTFPGYVCDPPPSNVCHEAK
ncbi:hypothetical protein Lesp02_53800 [Lentzea sp. NBRC 105346]|uniref:helix-turn-helix domain-containing protein n=1 Tax=Lentzea sp. NBRC 105346 TaxID=3032205 RepID=UPI0024A2E0CF|nr:helix-turn-helix domain-containing protein [Lentzea sp. NBRC 105346]GLZ33192.1 hypothetical protein Lesp02_53800 [Lentzea sp. NBRC 105346]